VLPRPCPTLAGFQEWLTLAMQVPSAAMPSSYLVELAYYTALGTVNRKLLVVPWDYQRAVYNLGGDRLVNVAQDPNPLPDGYPLAPGPINNKLTGLPLPYWAGLQQAFDVFVFTTGVVIAGGDETTNQTLTELDQYRGYTLDNLANLKTPWGREYLAIASKVGSLWGVT
jgi:hypothetical protein